MMMNRIKYFIEQLFDNRIINRIFLLISLINIVRSFLLVRKQHNILKSVINSNDEFFTALGLLGFKSGNFYNLESIHEVDTTLTDEEIYAIANKNIISTVRNFIEDEMLLGVIKIEVDKIKGQKIKFTINSAAYRLLLADAFDLFIALIINVIVFTVGILIIV